MKYNIHGFHQPRAVELGLTNDDLLVLRWFVDFAGTKKMKTIIEEDGIYYWVNYVTVLQDLPVLRISKTTLKRKHFDNLCYANVLKHKHIKEGGSFSYYAYGINYDTLVYLQDNDPSTKLDYPSTKLDEGYDEIEQGVVQNNTNKDYSINNNSIKNNKKEKYFDNEEINNIFIEFLEVRKKLKAVNSERAIKALVNKLNKYSDDIKFKMIERSVVNSWKDVYELKKEKNEEIKLTQVSKGAFQL